MVYPISRTRLSFTFEITIILTIVIYRHPKSGGTHVPSSCKKYFRTHAASCVFWISPPLSHHLSNNRLSKIFPPWTKCSLSVLSDMSVDPHMTSPATWRPFINNDKNEQPRESLHMILLINFFIPTKFRPSTCLSKYHAMRNSQGQIPLRWEKSKKFIKIPLLSTNQKAAFIYKGN